MKLVYIASPLRGDYNQNIKNTVEYCKNACDMGVLAIAPHDGLTVGQFNDLLYVKKLK